MTELDIYPLAEGWLRRNDPAPTIDLRCINGHLLLRVRLKLGAHNEVVFEDVDRAQPVRLWTERQEDGRLFVRSDAPAPRVPPVVKDGHANLRLEGRISRLVTGDLALGGASRFEFVCPECTARPVRRHARLTKEYLRAVKGGKSSVTLDEELPLDRMPTV